MGTKVDVPKLVTRREAAELLRVKVGTLACWACRGTGPRLTPIKVHGRTLYLVDEIVALIEGGSRTTGGNSTVQATSRDGAATHEE